MQQATCQTCGFLVKRTSGVNITGRFAFAFSVLRRVDVNRKNNFIHAEGFFSAFPLT
jgi:hypothetical protein